jgi:hypothetical protein
MTVRELGFVLRIMQGDDAEKDCSFGLRNR